MLWRFIKSRYSPHEEVQELPRKCCSLHIKRKGALSTLKPLRLEKMHISVKAYSEPGLKQLEKLCKDAIPRQLKGSSRRQIGNGKLMEKPIPVTACYGLAPGAI